MTSPGTAQRQAAGFSAYAQGFRDLGERLDNSGPVWTKDLRDHAWVKFTELGFPTARRGNESWKYTNVRPIASARFDVPLDLEPEGVLDPAGLRLAAPWDDSWVNIVFVDGLFSAGLSTDGKQAGDAQAASLLQAIATNGSLVQEHLGKYASVDDDGFTALNTTFLHDGAYIHVPAGQVGPQVLNLIYVTTQRPEPNVTFPRTLVLAGHNSRVTINENYVSLAPRDSFTEGFTNAVTEIVLEEGAQVEHHRLLRESPGGYHVGTTRVSQAQDSRFTSTSCAFGTALARHDLQVVLSGPGSSCELNGLYLTTDRQHMDNLINIDHASPHTSSTLFYKGVLDGKSKAVFGGTVLVRKDSQKVTARQTDKNLLLSKDAEVDSKPSLLIYADDVQCGHGATAGHIDPEALFYLRSRGLDLETASRFLVHAFAGEIIDTVGPAPLRDYLNQAFVDALPMAAHDLGEGQ